MVLDERANNFWAKNGHTCASLVIGARLGDAIPFCRDRLLCRNTSQCRLYKYDLLPMSAFISSEQFYEYDTKLCKDMVRYLVSPRLVAPDA